MVKINNTACQSPLPWRVEKNTCETHVYMNRQWLTRVRRSTAYIGMVKWFIMTGTSFQMDEIGNTAVSCCSTKKSLQNPDQGSEHKPQSYLVCAQSFGRPFDGSAVKIYRGLQHALRGGCGKRVTRARCTRGQSAWSGRVNDRVVAKPRRSVPGLRHRTSSESSQVKSRRWRLLPLFLLPGICGDPLHTPFSQMAWLDRCGSSSRATMPCVALGSTASTGPTGYMLL